MRSSCCTGSGRYSQWNGRASAKRSIRAAASAAAPRTLPMATLRDPDPEQGLLEGGPGDGQVGALVVAALERPLRLPPGLAGRLQADFRGEVGGLGHDDDLVRPNLDEAAEDGE